VIVPCAELRAILAPAFAPCFSFAGACRVARWNPRAGQIPRGFIGATEGLTEVRLILLLAEPGGGFSDESYATTASPDAYIEAAVMTAYRALSEKRTPFHANLRYVLDQCWPGDDLDEQLRKTWITETYLCSAENSAGSVPPLAEQACADTYLARQFAILPGRPIIALGGKAQRRVGRRARVIPAFAVGLPGANQRGARPSWAAAAAVARQQLGLAPAHG